MEHSPESNTKKVINIGGCVRSGTTLLNLIIANDPEAMALGEIQYVFRPNRKQHLVVIQKLKKDPIWSKVLSGGPENLYNNLFNFFPEINFFIDSSKNPGWYREQMAFNPDLKFDNIVIYKHPADQERSLLRRNQNSIWERLVSNYYQRFFQLIPNIRSISLTDLLNNKVVLEKLCDYLGMTYSDDKLDYWNRKHPNFYGSDTAGTRKKIDRSDLLEFKDITEIQDSFGSYQTELTSIYNFLKSRDINLNNYETTDYDLPLLKRISLSIRSKISDIKFRSKLLFRDYVKDREWLKEDEYNNV